MFGNTRHQSELRELMAAAMRRKGMKDSEISDRLKVTKSQANDLAKKGQLETDRSKR